MPDCSVRFEAENYPEAARAFHALVPKLGTAFELDQFVSCPRQPLSSKDGYRRWSFSFRNACRFERTRFERTRFERTRDDATGDVRPIRGEGLWLND